MSSLAQQVSASALRDRVFNDRQLSEMLGGGDARRYGLVNRAIKDGSLIRLKRGVYALAPAYRSAPVHPFAVAQALLPGSYISFESALAYHGWIPEAVLVTASVTPGRKTLEIPATEFGSFKYHPLAIADYRFLSGVERVTFDKLTASQNRSAVWYRFVTGTLLSFRNFFRSGPVAASSSPMWALNSRCFHASAP